jgi:hypothetical protein
MDHEIWKPVGAPFRVTYEVSNLGRVRGSMRVKRNDTQCSTRQGFLGLATDPREGYCKVSLALADGSGRKHVSVHRLVAIAFVPGDHSNDVNHKDMNKANNAATNLEWVPHRENIRHGMKNHPAWRQRLREFGGRKKRRVVSISASGERMAYDSLISAARALGGHSSNIHHALTTGGQSYGFRWAYADPEAPAT